MLDAFGIGSATKKAQKTANDDLQALINSAREERSALSEMLTQVTSRGSTLDTVRHAQEAAERVVGPDSDLQKHPAVALDARPRREQDRPRDFRRVL
jgi:hypothetical protein